MQPAEPIPRHAGRVLVIDSAGRVLLLENFDPAQPESRYWVTIGGGLDDCEEAVQAAVRELREETGIAAAVAGCAETGILAQVQWLAAHGDAISDELVAAPP